MVRARIGLKLGGLAEFLGFSQVWTSLVVSPKFNVNNKSKGVAKPSDNFMVGVIPIFMAKNIGINNFTSLSLRVLCCPVM